MLEALKCLPTAVRYIKNGAGSRWWQAARTLNQVHAGWAKLPDNLLETNDLPGIEERLRAEYDGNPGFKQDFNQLAALLDRPSRYVWTTIEDGCLWWCTVQDGITVNSKGESLDRGHFWLNCELPWSNRSLGGRELATANLPGSVEATRGFRGTNCTPDASPEMLRVIRDEEDVDAAAAVLTRQAYEAAVLKIVTRLHPKDFEVLVDLILSRTGWARIAKLGGVTEGIDVEVENAATDEVAFVQVKSKAGQPTLADYVDRFLKRPRYKRMIFAVHTAVGSLVAPNDPRIQVWDGPRIASLVVKHGLGDWVATRV
jgi:hypothetical protein